VKYCKSIYLHLIHHKLKYKIIFCTYFITCVYLCILCAIYLIKECIPLYIYTYEFKYIILLITYKEEIPRFALNKVGNMKHLLLKKIYRSTMEDTYYVTIKNLQ